MAVGAGSPELKLSIGFDLAYFRTQLPTLGKAASSYYLPINIKFDRLGIQNEFNKLGKNISGRQYNLKVEIKSLGAAITESGKLKDNLDALSKTKFTVDTTALQDAEKIIKNLQRDAADLLSTLDAVHGKAGRGRAAKGKTPAQQLDELQDIFGRGLSGQVLGGRGAAAASAARSQTDRQTLLDKLSRRSVDRGGYNKAGLRNIVQELGGTPGKSKSAELREQAIKLAQTVDNAVIARVWSNVKDLQMNMNRSRFMRDVGKLPQVVKGVGTSPTGFAKTPETINKEAVLGMREALAQGSKSILDDLLSVGKGLVALERGIARFIRGLPSTGFGNTISNAIGAGGRSAVGSGIKGGFLGATGGGLTGAGVGAFRGVKTVAAQGLSQWSEGGSLAHGLGAGMRKTASVLGGNTAGLETFVQQGREQVTNAILSTSLEGALVGLGGVGLVAGGLAFANKFGASVADDGKSAILETAKILFTKSAQLVVSAAKTVGPIAGRGLALTGQGVAEGTKRIAPYAQRGGRALGAGAIAGGIVTGEYAGKGLQGARDRLEDVLVAAYVAIHGISDQTTWRALKQRALALMGAMEIATVQVAAVGETSPTGVRKMLRGKDRANDAPLVPTSIVGTFVEDLGTAFQLASKYLPRPGEGQSGRKIQEGLDNIGKAAAEAARQALNKQARAIANANRAALIRDFGNKLPPLLPPASGGGGPRRVPSGLPAWGQSSYPGHRATGDATPQPDSGFPQVSSGGYARSAPLEVNPFYKAPSVPRNNPRISRSLGRAAMTGQEVPRGPRGGGAEADAIIKAAQNTLKLNLATNIARKSFEGFTASQLPLVGGLRSLGGEFAEATKQVLLYGTAYRALGFITSLPGQILNTAKSQQQYTNGLKVATQETGTFAKELLFVDNVQRAFGLNLETTRVGFTRLYASMAPTGFDSGSIEKLFTGISAATASLQLTPDKAERVIYAFGQMASKGQIMSEELKGQLGDVLPGALAIFAKAAGMSVKEFSKAMEDGEFVGNRFREVFAKVSDELMNRFGTGAQAAGKSLQGLLNTVGGDFQRTLESFAPLADSAAQAILVPLGGALRQLSTSAQIAMGEIDRVREQYKTAIGDVRDLRAGGASADQIKAAEQNVSALAARYRSLNQALENPAVAKQVKDIQLFVQELTKAGTFVMNVAQTIGGILAPALNFLGTNLTATIATITSFYIGFQTARLAASALMGVLLLYRGLTALMGLSTVASQATALAGAFNILGVSASGAQVKLIGLRVALTALVATTVVGAVVAGIVAIAGAFATMGNRARDAAQGSREAAKAAMDAASTGNVAGAAMNVQTVLAESRKNELARKTLQRIQARATKEQKKGAAGMRITPEESAALQGSALTSGMITAGVSRGGFREIRALSSKELETRLQEFGSVAGQSLIDLKETKAAFAQAQKVSKLTGQNQPTPGATTLENEATKDKTKAKSLEGYYKLEDDLAKAITDGEIDRANMLFEHRKNLLNTYYDIQDARANSFQKETIKFQREITNIEMDRQKSALDAQNAVKKIQGSVAGGATGLLQGSTGVSSGAHFDVRRQDGKYISPEEARALFDPAIAKQLSLTSKYGPRTAPAPGASTFHRGVDLAGPANTPLNLAAGYSMMGAGEKGGLGFTASVRGPQGTMYDVGHLQRPGAGAGAIRPVKGNESRDIKAEAKTQIELQKESLALKYADALAIERQKVAMENYVAAIMPLAEQKLQNQLLAQRNQLQLSGAGDAEIEQKTKVYELDIKKADLEERINALKKKGESTSLSKVETALLDQATKALAELNANYQQYIANLVEARRLKAESAYASNMSALRDQLQLGGIIDPYAELRQKYIQADQTPVQADEQVKLQQQLDFITKLRDGYRGVADAIGNSFGEAFKGIVSGSMTAQQALAGMFQSIADSFLDMVAQMIAAWLKTQVIKGFQAIFGAALGAFGGGLGAAGGTGGTGVPEISGGFYQSMPSLPMNFTAANGGIATGGFRAFASGGIVTGPTLGLVGEGRYNEAVIPLPDGKSVPVDLGGAGMGGNQITSNIVVNVTSDGQSQSQQSGNDGAKFGKVLEATVKQVIINELRPGGTLSSRR